MANKFPLILNTSANQIQEIASGDNLDLTGCGINNAGVITATSFSGNGSGLIGVASTDYIVTGTAATFNNTTNFNGNVNISSNIDVDGHTNLDNVSIAGVTTMSGDITISNTSPKISLVDTNNNDDFDLMNADGIFQIVDATNSANRLTIDSTGTVNVPGNLDVGAGVDVTGNVVASGNVSGVDGTFTGNVSIGGTLTYEDVTNIDSVGLITARNGINVSGGTATFQGAIDANSDLDVDGHTNLDNVSIAGVVTFTGASYNAVWDKAQNRLEFADNAAAMFGTDEDLLIYNNNSNSLIDHSGAGNLQIRTLGSAEKIELLAAGHIDIKTASGGKNSIVCTANYGVDIYYNNSPKIQTTNTGAIITGICTATTMSSGTITCTDWFTNNAAGEGIRNSQTGQYFFSQASNETRLYHGSNNQIKLTFRGNGDVFRGAVDAQPGFIALKTGADEVAFVARDNTTAELYFNGNKKIETSNTGAVITGICTATTFSGSGASLTNVNATTLDSIDSTSFARSDIEETITGKFEFTSSGSFPLKINGSDDAKIKLSGSSNPYIRFQEGTTDKAYIQWNAGGYLKIGNDEDSSQIRIKDTFDFSPDNSTFHTVVHAGNVDSYIGITTEQVTPSSNVATLNLAKDDHKIVASGTYTVNVSGGTEAGSHTLRIENSGTANVGFSTYFKFPSGGTPSLPTASGAISLISFTVHKVGSVGIATVLLAGASVNYS